MSDSRGLGAFLEQKAEGPAYAIVALCIASRAASFFSGGALVLRQLLGVQGLGIYNGVTGMGIAVGSGLVMSVAGRAWRAALKEVHEAGERKGLTKPERLNLQAYWKAEATRHFRAMVAAMCFETAAALFFFWSGNQQHDWVTFLSESLVAVAAVFVAFYFGVMKDSHGVSAKEEAKAIAHTARLKAVREAGERIARGEGTKADVYLASQDLDKQERAGFVAALLPGSDDDPVWSVNDILAWLGSQDPALRRKVYRLLGKLETKVPDIVNDPAMGWRVPQSAAHKHLMPLFLELHGGPVLQAVVTRASRVRHLPRGNGQEEGRGHDRDETETRESEVNSGLVAVNN